MNYIFNRIWNTVYDVPASVITLEKYVSSEIRTQTISITVSPRLCCSWPNRMFSGFRIDEIPVIYENRYHSYNSTPLHFYSKMANVNSVIAVVMVTLIQYDWQTGYLLAVYWHIHCTVRFYRMCHVVFNDSNASKKRKKERCFLLTYDPFWSGNTSHTEINPDDRLP